MTRRRASVFLSVSAVCALGCGDDGATGDAGDAASRMDGTPAGDTSRPPPDTAVPTGDYDCDNPEASWLL
jgi:hypothetical protein